MANYFQGARDFTITGGTFGQDYSRHTTYRGPVHRTNDYSQYTTNYGGYVNYGQHADRGGTINNVGPQTTNNGTRVYGQQYPGLRGGNRNGRSPRPPSPPEFDALPRNPIPNSRRDPPADPPIDNDPIYGDSDGNLNDGDDDLSSDEDGPRFPPRPGAQLRAVPSRRPQRERPGNLDESLDEELRNMSPEMQRYVQKLIQQGNGGPTPPVRPDRDLQGRMADMQLDDAESSRSPAGRRSPRARPQNQNRRDPNRPPRGTRLPHAARIPTPYRENAPEDETESDGDSVPLHRHTIITNTDSQNVTSTTVVDSHNDNSTKTEISKPRSGREG